jgi:hypothetical protein
MSRLQHRLRLHIQKHIFGRLPPTGISNKDVDQFQAYCRYLISVLEQSPRSVLLRRISSLLEQRLVSGDASLRELMSLLQHTSRPPLLTALMDSHENLTPGPLFKSYQFDLDKSQENPFNEDLVVSIRAGILRKRPQTSPGDLNGAVLGILQKGEQLRARHAESAQLRWPQVLTDRSYLTFQKARFPFTSNCHYFS